MTISTRLTRAAVAFLIFGTVASVLPMDTSALAAPGYPGVSNGNGRGRRNRGLERAAEVAAAGAAIYFLIAGDKKRDNEKKPNTNAPDPQFEKLDRFTRPSDAPANPGMNP